MHSRTMNMIYPLGGRHAALHAGTWSYGKRGSGTGWQEGDETPQLAEAHQRAKLSLALPPAEGSVLPDLPCLICHCNVSSERRVLIVGNDVREHGLKVTPLIVGHHFLVGQRERPCLLFEMAACPIFCLAIKRKRVCVHAALSCT